MKTKTFKIGEYCIGGILKLTIGKDGSILIRAIDWKLKFVVQERRFEGQFAPFDIEQYLNDLTSSYHASKVMKWLRG